MPRVLGTDELAHPRCRDILLERHLVGRGRALLGSVRRATSPALLTELNRQAPRVGSRWWPRLLGHGQLARRLRRRATGPRARAADGRHRCGAGRRWLPGHGLALVAPQRPLLRGEAAEHERQLWTSGAMYGQSLTFRMVTPAPEHPGHLMRASGTLSWPLAGRSSVDWALAPELWPPSLCWPRACSRGPGSGVRGEGVAAATGQHGAAT